MRNFSAEFLNKLKDAKRVVFFTGAGISAESGIPTFRGKEGIWNKLKPEELANINAFLSNPNLVWEWYQHRRKIVNESEPNNGHLAISNAQNYFDEVVVITQNVDNLHKRAGSKLIYELHGNIEKNFCIKCKKRFDFANFELKDKAPLCECGGLIRPDVVWFGEFLPEDQYEQSLISARYCDLLFIVGTSAVVYPAAYIPLEAIKYKKYVVEINIEKTEISDYVNESFFGKAGEVLPEIIEMMKHLK